MADDGGHFPMSKLSPVIGSWALAASVASDGVYCRVPGHVLCVVLSRSDKGPIRLVQRWFFDL